MNSKEIQTRFQTFNNDFLHKTAMGKDILYIKKTQRQRNDYKTLQ